MFWVKLIKAERIRILLTQWKRILREEGFLPLFTSMVTFFIRLLFSYQLFYLYEKTLDPSDEIPIVPCKVSGLTIRPIFLPITLKEYERLGANNFDFSLHPEARDYENYLDKGTIVFWTTLNGEFVNRTGMTTMRKGSTYEYLKKYYPSFIDDGYTAYAGFSETAVKYRLKGVYSWVHSEIYRYFREKGIYRVLLLEENEQVGPRKVQARMGAKVLSEVYHLRVIILFNFRWVRPCTESFTPSVP